MSDARATHFGFLAFSFQPSAFSADPQGGQSV